MENEDKDFEKLAQEGEDAADDLYNEGFCLECRGPNDLKEKGSRVCSKCSKKQD
jgi:hypothetical protein